MVRINERIRKIFFFLGTFLIFFGIFILGLMMFFGTSIFFFINMQYLILLTITGSGFVLYFLTGFTGLKQFLRGYWKYYILLLIFTFFISLGTLLSPVYSNILLAFSPLYREIFYGTLCGGGAPIFGYWQECECDGILNTIPCPEGALCEGISYACKGTCFNCNCTVWNNTSQGYDSFPCEPG